MSPIPEPVAIEARARILWGEKAEKVHAYLLAEEVNSEDAWALLAEINTERLAAIRHDGVAKIWLGLPLVLLPVALYFFSLHAPKVNARGFTAAIALGAIGLVMLTKGISMALRPESISGDLSNGRD